MIKYSVLLIPAVLLFAPLGHADPSVDQLKHDHTYLKETLAYLDSATEALSSGKDAHSQETMKKVADALHATIHHHAQWEEASLYGEVDRLVGECPHPFTASMRYEHTLIAKKMDILAEEAAKSVTDSKQFARKTDKLLGLIEAHFEEEEKVLLPVLAAYHEKFKQESKESD